MSVKRAAIISSWLGLLAIAGFVVAHARYITDLSAFLPARPTPMQQLLVEQLRDGPTSRLILIALEHGDLATRGAISRAMARALRRDPEFSLIGNGEAVSAERDREFLFRHRYLLSDAVSAQHFSVAGLRRSLEGTVLDLSAPEGLILKSLVPHDPTGELLEITDRLARTQGPPTRGGVWVSLDGERTLLIAETAALGSDTDAAEHALTAIRAAFAAAVATAAVPAARDVRLRTSGAGVFAVAARAQIKAAAMRLSILSSALVVVILLSVYRSWRALLLGLAPVATGALTGVAAVALGFGAVHGVTLGFGITLIGESVDYSIYFFIQAAPAWRRQLWPTIRLGMLTSVCGFASLLPSGFPGLAQLGAYSISGLLAAAAVTRFVLPALLPRDFAIRDLSAWGARLAQRLEPARQMSDTALIGGAVALAVLALLVLYRHRESLWNRELSALSPIPAAALLYDAQLRTDVGAANVTDLVVVSGESVEAALEGAERTGRLLEPLIAAGVIGGFDSPAHFLPSLALQGARRSSLPDGATLRANLREASAGLALDPEQLGPFIEDVEAARRGALIEPAELAGTSLAAGFDALMVHRSKRWDALLPLHAADPSRPTVDLARLRRVLADSPASTAQLLDFKQESDALYAGYLREAMRLCAIGFLAIIVLLGCTLRAAARVLRVMAPLVLAVLAVAAALALLGRQLTLMHLVGMLLIVAVGSNYALFFDARGGAHARADEPLTLASLSVANLCTVVGFGLLSFSGVPVLEALGVTVAPGAVLALLFAAVLTPQSSDA